MIHRLTNNHHNHDVAAIRSVMLKFYFKPENVRVHPGASCFLSLAEMIDGSKINYHITIEEYNFQDLGGSTHWLTLAHSPIPTKMNIPEYKSADK